MGMGSLAPVPERPGEMVAEAIRVGQTRKMKRLSSFDIMKNAG